MTKASDALRRHYTEQAAEFDRALLKANLTDNGEAIIDVTAGAQHDAQNIIFAKPCSPYLRASVAKALLDAAVIFKEKGYTLRLESAYRSLKNQKERFQKRYEEIKEKSPRLSRSEILAQAQIYTAGIPVLAAHTAGAAVDVTLVETAAHTPVDFGSPYKHGGIESITEFSGLPKKVKANRQLLKEGMEKAGFINYPFEYWHYSIGDVCAAYITGADSAIYGPVDFNEKINQQTLLTGDLIYKPFIEGN